jgi:hypothetical protein
MQNDTVLVNFTAVHMCINTQITKKCPQETVHDVVFFCDWFN